ncbi:methyltransferase domain-containing protein [Agromyces protaetiae]|uniref:Methyltransferase domain-containing protein n=1 Tax=Agromyces protaetiae TaxID=2509455 RepID=A0A4P6FCP6_9MICO|nr:class I SAM-dependent methyltransferase [Agromyces protaetiae]QAY73595.1 methyltransferase domain-containing protein [Agromyces protaetiae]
MTTVDRHEGDWLDDNRANWDDRVPVHVASPFYDRDTVRSGGSVLDPISKAGVERLFPEGLDGVRVLHLQCHFGSDTLSLANLGATVIGLDFSRPAVEEARSAAAALGYDSYRARFIEGNVYDARRLLPEPESFDLVFVTWGTINWLPDVAEWARIVAWFLKPGGRLYFADGHPTAWMFDAPETVAKSEADVSKATDASRPVLPVVRYPYAQEGPDVLEDPSDYADPGASIEHARTWEWAHPLSETMRALRDAGLAIDEFEEHYRLPWQAFPGLSELGEGMYGWPAEPWIPLAVEIVARHETSAER